MVKIFKKNGCHNIFAIWTIFWYDSSFLMLFGPKSVPILFAFFYFWNFHCLRLKVYNFSCPILPQAIFWGQFCRRALAEFGAKWIMDSNKTSLFLQNNFRHKILLKFIEIWSFFADGQNSIHSLFQSLFPSIIHLHPNLWVFTE